MLSEHKEDAPAPRQKCTLRAFAFMLIHSFSRRCFYLRFFFAASFGCQRNARGKNAAKGRSSAFIISLSLVVHTQLLRAWASTRAIANDECEVRLQFMQPGRASCSCAQRKNNKFPRNSLSLAGDDRQRRGVGLVLIYAILWNLCNESVGLG